MKTRIHKLLNWEHWPSYMFYIPNLPYAFYLALKAKHLTFFSAANPSIKSSGNGTESKYQTLQLVPKKYRPKSILVPANIDFKDVLTAIKDQAITFPLIAKPDIGFRGLLVEKIFSKNELKTYLERYPIDIIIQEFLDYKYECGVFYLRNPKDKTGKISSLTLKRFLSVMGDGNTTLKELMLSEERAKLYLPLLEKIHQDNINKIPKKGEKVFLSSIGNHSKGTEFINGNHLITKELEKSFDTLSKVIPGWFYGRIDLKYNSFEELEKGLNFKILEINGILAEPTHMYDAKNYTYFKALKTIRLHWNSLFKIATANHKEFDIPYKSPKKFANELLELKNYVSFIKKLR
ncbi:hypothetical protein [Tenacibaculum maritimum]|uniref:Ribosomal S6 modification enzyme RimK n=1 Tax=Tenacibaculum maritimum NCIMB 2154 TaxID=1349785 RepID=A0A2H1EAV2_9FLAO|nr:hypothetical protein [Tenacibaculum maritimum]SFZ83613.1 Ribosomal S6 modification enzyme RimK [Tenacibaculum maritimum NCIMB 2154]